MSRRIGIISFCVVCSLAFHPARAQDGQNGQDEPVLIASPALRMPPLRPPETTGNAPQTAEALAPDASCALDIRPPGYNFAEVLLNQDAGASEFLPSVELARAIALHDFSRLSQLLNDGADPNAPLPQPAPASLTALFDDPYIRRELMKDSRVTPLMLAVLTRQRGAVALLMQHGANTEISTRTFHMYALDFAAELDDIPVMQLLLGHEPTADGEGRHIVISLYAQKAWLMSNHDVLLEIRVSTGRPGFTTKTGEFVVTQKYTSWKSTLYKAAMPNFMRLNCSQAGLHAGYVPGVPASHGCIRLPPTQAGILYGSVHLGDRVSIVE